MPSTTAVETGSHSELSAHERFIASEPVYRVCLFILDPPAERQASLNYRIDESGKSRHASTAVVGFCYDAYELGEVVLLWRCDITRGVNPAITSLEATGCWHSFTVGLAALWGKVEPGNRFSIHPWLSYYAG